MLEGQRVNTECKMKMGGIKKRDWEGNQRHGQRQEHFEEDNVRAESNSPRA